MKNTITILAYMAAITCTASIPLKWTVETSRVHPATFEAYHGETLELAATMKSYGNDLAIAEDASIFWQTNGMGSVFWSAPATVAGNILSASFTPAMDSGASYVNGFIGTPGENYRASFRIRFINSPGAVPSVLDMPIKTLDFASVTVENAPYYSKDETVSAIASALDGHGSVVTNIVDGIASRNLRDKGDLAVYTVYLPAPMQGGSGSSSQAHYRYNYVKTSDTLVTSSALEESIGEAAENIKQDVLSECDVIYDDVSLAMAYASGVYNYMNANTNAWFAGTNYVIGAEAENRHRFVFEDGMDLLTVPCSMALYEMRDGSKAKVWDQRDWTSWYWRFKSSQLMDEIEATNAVIRSDVSGRAPAAWASRTAATGLVNPDMSTTWVDTPTVTLAPGMAWESVADVGGCAYWTIVGRNVQLGGNPGESYFQIKDFEGKPVMTITKTASYLAYLECGSDIYNCGRDDQGRITCTMRATVKPIAEFALSLDEDFLSEEEDACPASLEWEQVNSSTWRIHFIARPELNASSCFARFKVEVQGSTTVEYADAPTIHGGLIFNGVKIAPRFPNGKAVGAAVTWEVVQ